MQGKPNNNIESTGLNNQSVASRPAPVSSVESLEAYYNSTASTSMDHTTQDEYQGDNQGFNINSELFSMNEDPFSSPSHSIVGSGEPRRHTLDMSAIPKIAATHPTGSIPEFLYQLTKMLTEDNSEVIEWEDDKIKVHNPHKLQADVLGRYFRHSKFASFQRQLNYFGFRKIAGKGKMAPCAYVNEAARGDINNLLMIKRKNGNVSAQQSDDACNRRESSRRSSSRRAATMKERPEQVEPLVVRKPTVGSDQLASSGSQQGIAKLAVGKGIRHGYQHSQSVPFAQPRSKKHINALTVSTGEASGSEGPGAATRNLKELESNFALSMIQKTTTKEIPDSGENQVDPTPLSALSGRIDDSNFDTFLDRESSLVDLAMIPGAEDISDDGTGADNIYFSNEWNFIDFPQPEVDPRNRTRDS